MNERIKRIKQLAEQANVLHTEFFDNEWEVKKFAELIVRECADVAAFGHGPTDSGLIKREVLEHFGFEE